MLLDKAFLSHPVGRIVCMFDAGVDTPLDELLPVIHSIAGSVDVEHLDVTLAARLVEQCAEAERVLAALRVLAAATLQDRAVWRREGFRSVAEWMASKTGGAVGPAIDALGMVEHLPDLPVVAEAFRGGRLSAAQAVEIVDVASEAPETQEQLLEAAGKLSLRGLREECQRVKASVIVDEEDRYRRVHRSRRMRAWVDRHNVGRLNARMTPDELARFMTEVERRCDTVFLGDTPAPPGRRRRHPRWLVREPRSSPRRCARRPGSAGQRLAGRARQHGPCRRGLRGPRARAYRRGGAV